MGEGFAVAKDAAKAFPGLVGADIEVAQEAPPGPLVIGGDLIGGHISLEGPAEIGAGRGLEQAVLHVGKVVGPGGVEADGGLDNGELDFIAITVCIFRAVYYRNWGGTASNSGKAVLYLLPLELQFLGIGHVTQGAAAAGGEIGAVRLQPGGGGGLDLQHVAPGAGFAHLVQLDQTGFPLKGLVHEAGHAVGKMGHPLAVGAVALNEEGERGRERGLFHGRDLL
jgi:hypothetical protein